MSGWGNDNSDDEGRETDRGNPKSVSGRAHRRRSSDDSRCQRATVLRIKARVKQRGVKGVVHGNWGRVCQRKVKNKTVQRIVELARGKYHGFNDHHLTEKLKEHEQIELSREKVHRILRSEGISTPRKRRASKHRSRRERRMAEGMMLQVDGSPHD